MRVLLVEDNERFADFVRKGLCEAGHTVEIAENGRDGLLRAVNEAYDAVVLDRMLPGGIDGIGIIEALRAAGNRTPILILSALGEVDERIKGLKAGGDDYLAKPFALGELVARLEALVRRGGAAPVSTLFRVGDLELDLITRRASRAGKTITLLPREFQLLEYLMRHAGQIVTRTMLLEGIWNYHFDPETNVIDVHVSKLRQKIDAGHDQPLLHTIRGVGYRLSAR
jgi:two-component system, OmpR family, response regulator